MHHSLQCVLACSQNCCFVGSSGCFEGNKTKKPNQSISPLPPPDLEDPPITLTSRGSRMRHSSQSDDAPPASEVFHGGTCDLDAPAPSSLARSSSASDIMEPFIAERVKGEEPKRDPASIATPPHHQPHHPTTSSSLAANRHAAQPLPHTPTTPSPSPCAFSDSVPSSEGLDDGSDCNHFWQQTCSLSAGSCSDWVSDWDAAFTCSSEKDAEEGEGGAGVEEDDLFSSIRDYLTHKGTEWKEEAGEKDSSALAFDSVAAPPPPVQTVPVRTQRGNVGQVGDLGQDSPGFNQDGAASKSVTHNSVDSAEDPEAERRSIYECLELQCEWPSTGARGSASLERKGGGAATAAGLEGKAWRDAGEEKRADNERSRQNSGSQESSVESNQTVQTSDPLKSKLSRSGAKRLQSGGVHVSFRPSTESVQFHNPIDSKEAHWKARLRRLSHFHTHSHSAGERPGGGSASKLGVGGAGKFGSAAAIGHRSGSHEKSAGGTVVDASEAGNSAEARAAASAADREKQQHAGANQEVQPEATPSVSGVRGRLGRSALRSRASRSRSQEPGSSATRHHHHQGALLGGVYKSVVHALSSKPRPRGQGSSQGSSPQRQGRAAMGDASLRDLYSHVLGYFGRKTTSAGEGRRRRRRLAHIKDTTDTERNNSGGTERHRQTNTDSWPFYLFGCFFFF